ncbi:MAG: hypothetical protein JSS22_11180 [Proteobacteria bacterium]|nr:hypothetical protein [Pseudomonadota bacterium]
MVDDSPNDPSQEASRPKRAPPTIDLEATEVSRAADEAGPEDAGKTADDQQPLGEQPVSPRAPSRTSSAAISAIAGVLAAGLVVGGAWLAGWPASSSAPQVSSAEFGDLSTRVASVESKVAKPLAPAADPAAAARFDALEKSVTSLRGELAAVRGQSDKLAAAVKDVTAAPREAASAPGLSAIDARLAQIEQTVRTLTAETADRKSTPADDVPLRRVMVATLLNVSVRQGEPYGEILAASKALAADPGILKPLEMFESSGVPNANVLCRQLLVIVPKLAPASATTAGTGIVNRLQEGAARLVRIERTDAPVGDSANAIVARITASALHNDVAAARAGLNALPPADRAAAQSWIAKADARDAALAASRQFAADAMGALTKPVQ